MLKRFCVVCLVFAAVLFVASCAGEPMLTAEPTAASTAPSAAPTVEASAEPSAAPETTDDFLDLSAPDADALAALAGNESLTELYLEKCSGTVVLPEIPNLESFHIEWNGGVDGTIDLSACASLKSISIFGKRVPNALNLGESVERLYLNQNEGEFDEDYIASLPNLKWLTPNKSYDLAKLPPLERLSLFIGECDLSVLENAEIEVLVVGGADTHGIHDETLVTFRGAKSLRAMQISDEYITDIAPILDYAPELEILLLSADCTQENWPELNMAEVKSENAELLDLLESNIPREQLNELIARGCKIQLLPDYAVRQ